MAAPSGTTWGSTVGSYGRIGIYVDVLSDTATQLKYEVEVWFWSKYSVSDSGNTLYYDHKTSSGSASTSRGSKTINTTHNSGSGWSTSNQKRLGTYGPYTINRTTSSQKRYIYAKLTNVDVVGGTMYVSKTYAIAAKDSYTVTYNANGGTGAPDDQKKWHDDDLVLSDTKPSRTGYTFQGWGISADDTSVDYAPGASYTTNAAATLYAIWKINTWTVSYNANGGTGAPASQTKTYGKTLTLSGTKPTRTNYNFKGWATSASSTTVVYAAGGSYTANAGATLYAVWELAYKKPTISGLSIKRWDSVNDKEAVGDELEATSGLVSFSWTTFNTVSKILIEWKSGDGSIKGSKEASASGTSGSVNEIIGNNDLPMDQTFTIRVTVSDSGGDTPKEGTLVGYIFTIDMLGGGKGVSFGKPAELEGCADFAFKTMHRQNSTYTNNMRIYGLKPDGVTEREAFQPQNQYGNTIIGWGNYNNQDGNTNVYGHGVNITANNDVTVQGCRVAENKVLWSGVYWMIDTQTATLSEAISKQANGIVLIFSAYRDGAESNVEFTSHFIPKHFVSAHAGKGMSFFMLSGGFGHVAAKYLYISDTSIVGYAGNNETDTKNGITYNNAEYVLRYVVGV